MKRLIWIAAMLTGIVVPLASLQAQLEATYREHGGLERWRFFGAVSYDLTWQSGDTPARIEHHLVGLRTRKILITADQYKIGFDGTNCWVSPNLAAFQGPPARFWVSTPFYFFSMPFVFADPGAIVRSQGRKTFLGRECDVVKVTFDQGVGDTAEDDYMVYLEPFSRKIRLVHYVVTYPSLRCGKPIDQLERHALVFEDWQEVDRLVVPLKGKFYLWRNDNIQGEPIGTVMFANARFRRIPPPPQTFAQPAAAEVDQSRAK